MLHFAVFPRHLTPIASFRFTVDESRILEFKTVAERISRLIWANYRAKKGKSIILEKSTFYDLDFYFWIYIKIIITFKWIIIFIAIWGKRWEKRFIIVVFLPNIKNVKNEICEIVLNILFILMKLIYISIIFNQSLV